MGVISSSTKRCLFSPKQVRVLIVGLDAAGKTTTLYKLKLGEVVTTIPTIGFNVETIEYKNVSFTAWDIGGRGNMRALIRHYYQNTQALILVVDSNDRDRLEDVRENLSMMLCEDELHNVPLLVYANKQDLPNAMPVAEMTDKLGLHSIRARQWYIQAACAGNGDGLLEGLDWLSRTLSKSNGQDESIAQQVKCKLCKAAGMSVHDALNWLPIWQASAKASRSLEDAASLVPPT